MTQNGTTSSVNMARNERLIFATGGMLMLTAGLVRRDWIGAGMGAVGVDMMLRGVTGRSIIYPMLGENRAVHNQSAAISVPHEQGIRVTQNITIGRPLDELYAFWRDFTNLPHFMKHLESVTINSPTHSHWKVTGPAGVTIEWDAEIINEENNKVIGWRSLKNPYVDHAGSVRFREAPGQRGTEINVTMEYIPLGGTAGRLLASLFGDAPSQQIYEDLHRLKQHLEVGEVATIAGQPSGRKDNS
jgi:uncharacterized membrane protein